MANKLYGMHNKAQRCMLVRPSHRVSVRVIIVHNEVIHSLISSEKKQKKKKQK